MEFYSTPVAFDFLASTYRNVNVRIAVIVLTDVKLTNQLKVTSICIVLLNVSEPMID